MCNYHELHPHNVKEIRPGSKNCPHCTAYIATRARLFVAVGRNLISFRICPVCQSELLTRGDFKIYSDYMGDPEYA